MQDTGLLSFGSVDKKAMNFGQVSGHSLIRVVQQQLFERSTRTGTGAERPWIPRMVAMFLAWMVAVVKAEWSNTISTDALVSVRTCCSSKSDLLAIIVEVLLGTIYRTYRFTTR